MVMWFTLVYYLMPLIILPWSPPVHFLACVYMLIKLSLAFNSAVYIFPLLCMLLRDFRVLYDYVVTAPVIPKDP